MGVNDLSNELLRDNFVELLRRMKLKDFLDVATVLFPWHVDTDESDNEYLMGDEIFDVDLRRKASFAGKAETNCVSLTGNVLDFSLVELNRSDSHESLALHSF